ncbi:hypothetical protein MTR67_044212 [Solanum verrucosum]|uniref:Uncharacterized protein n=1 Tax=Solanum verrucosum TaxID=315347 RepID=A0AAF0UQW1_SOLVR|nr:hypothetical protein MTR67_044212 [Solanum verrucosum]
MKRSSQRVVKQFHEAVQYRLMI